MKTSNTLFSFSHILDEHTHSTREILKDRTTQRFDESVDQVVLVVDSFHVDMIIRYALSNKVVLMLYVFHTLMKFEIFCDFQS